MMLPSLYDWWLLPNVDTFRGYTQFLMTGDVVTAGVN